MNPQISSRLSDRYAPITDQGHCFPLELGTEYSPSHRTPPVASLHLTGCPENSGKLTGPVNADAFSNLMQLADQGDADAQYKLGVMYGDGLGVKQNSAEAVRWYRKAADQGHVDAQLNLGAAYSFGFGVKGNSAEAVRWYRKAADQGHADAQLNLCLMYARGHNVRQNNVTAYMLCSLAASPPTSRASDEAQQLLKILTSNMTPAQITEAQKLAQEWKPTQPEQK